MAQPAPWSRTGLWRLAVVAVSAGLATVAVCLVVFGTSQKQVQLGVLLGLWAGLLAAYLMYGSRHAEPEPAPVAEWEEARAQASELHQAQLKVATMQQEQLEAAKQAHFSQQIASELGSLREEVAALRAEVLDKLGGQLRLERIETTRVIGSDLEALQNEIRRLAGAQPASRAQSTPTAGPVPSAQPGSPAERVPPAHRGELRPADIVDAELVEFPPPPAIAELAPARPAGRRRASEPDATGDRPRYQGRRRAEGQSADRWDSVDH
jgi:hypothetical protein